MRGAVFGLAGALTLALPGMACEWPEDPATALTGRWQMQEVWGVNRVGTLRFKSGPGTTRDADLAAGSDMGLTLRLDAQQHALGLLERDRFHMGAQDSGGEAWLNATLHVDSGVGFAGCQRADLPQWGRARDIGDGVVTRRILTGIGPDHLVLFETTTVPAEGDRPEGYIARTHVLTRVATE